MSWVKTLKEVSRGEVTVPLYDAEGYAQVKRAMDKGEDVTAVTPLVSIVVNYPGSYSKFNNPITAGFSSKKCIASLNMLTIFLSKIY